MNGILRSGDTTFIGIDAGEWVAGLFALEADGGAQEVFPGNLNALPEWNRRAVFLSGPHQMGMDHGAVCELQQADDTWKANFLHAMPGRPWTGAIPKEGRLFANCRGGAVAISRDETFGSLGCEIVAPKEQGFRPCPMAVHDCTLFL